MILISVGMAIAGAVGVSIAEHMLGVNFVDKGLSYFRSAEAEVNAAERKLAVATTALKSAVARVTKRG